MYRKTAIQCCLISAALTVTCCSWLSNNLYSSSIFHLTNNFIEKIQQFVIQIQLLLYICYRTVFISLLSFSVCLKLLDINNRIRVKIRNKIIQNFPSHHLCRLHHKWYSVVPPIKQETGLLECPLKIIKKGKSKYYRNIRTNNLSAAILQGTILCAWNFSQKKK